MRRFWRIIGLAALLFVAGVRVFVTDEAFAAANREQRHASDTKASAPSISLIDQYCVTCHNDRLKVGDLSLVGIDVSKPELHGPVLEKVVRKLRAKAMPPEGRPRPDAATFEAFVQGLEASLDRVATVVPNVGHVTSRRLNRTEYVNAIYDLLGLEVNGAELLPSDMAGFGFDNNADVLSITPALMARYMFAATKISRVAVGSSENRPSSQVYKVQFENQSARMGEDMPFATRGGVAVRHTFPLDGEYLFQVRLQGGDRGGIQGIDEAEHQIELRVDRALLKRFAVGGQFKGKRDPGTLIAIADDDLEGKAVHDYRLNADKVLDYRIPIKAGTYVVSAGFTVSAPSPGISRIGGPSIDRFMISGPFKGNTPGDTTPSRKKIFTCRPTNGQSEEPCARQILASLARRAYRRPVTDADVGPLLSLYKRTREASNFDMGIERALEAMLSSPNFLIRAEREPVGAKTGVPYRLRDLELATRLAFFLWKSIPDDALLDVAAGGRLRDPKVLEGQVRRMLADRRATRFMKDFVQQWLEVRNILTVEPDENLFPSFDNTLRKAMLKEVDLFFESQVRGDHSLHDLMRADYTFLNELLARHYGIQGIYGSHFRRVTLKDEQRFGLLGKAAVLTVTSYANRTSVVVRGKWILENILGTPPPPPPANVPPLKENDGKSRPTSLRERMEAHRSNPVCASCHTRMDPLGFALEHFDAIGSWRETDGGAEINASIELGGKKIPNVTALRESLLTDTDEFVGTVMEKLLTYALGRGLEYYDQPTIRQLVRDVARDEYRWSSVILGIIKSGPFQMSMPVEMRGAPPATTSVARSSTDMKVGKGGVK